MNFLSNLIFEPKGVYDPNVDYDVKDTVTSIDGSRVYFARRNVPAGTALTDEDFWILQIDLSNAKKPPDGASGWVNVVSYGVVADGATDNSDIIQSLLDANRML